MTDAWSTASVCHFAYLTARGEPLCWPVTPFWYPDRQVLGVATGVAYPNKARCARRNPKVAALLEGGPGRPPSLLQGDATVLDEDLQANTDRYVGEMRERFVSARFGLNALSVKLLDFYLPRIWIEVTPVFLEPAGGGTSLVPPPGDAPPDSGPVPGPALAALDRWVRRQGRAVVTLAGAGGYPIPAMTAVEPGPAGSVRLASAPGSGPAALTFHSESLGGVRLDALMARGWVTPDPSGSGGFLLTPRRVVGFLGRPPEARPAFASIFPLSQLPRSGDFRGALTRELSRRGEALPHLRVPRAVGDPGRR